MIVACRSSQWVMLVYRLPRTPSTPRITLWRKLRRLGVAQIVDGVVALPASADSREQLEWLAEDVVQAGGEATIWLAEPATAAEHRTPRRGDDRADRRGVPRRSPPRAHAAVARPRRWSGDAHWLGCAASCAESAARQYFPTRPGRRGPRRGRGAGRRVATEAAA